MADLKVEYLGLELRNPVIAGSSTHTINVDSVKRLEEAGAGAVVLKSIFEEQIRADVAGAYDELANSPQSAALEYLRADLPMRMGPQKYLERIHEMKRAVKIPVIASINCVTSALWTDFATRIERAGADALELNIYDIPADPGVTSADIENRHLQLVEEVKARLGIPVAVKIGPFYTSIMDFARRLSDAHVRALVLFNRFFQPDIDVETMKLKSSVSLSRPEDMMLPLRWVAILRDHVRCDLSLTTGVHDWAGAIKAILVGADTVQVTSVLYREGPEAVSKIVSGIAEWMDRKGCAKVSAFRGMLREKDLTDNAGFERAQYVKALVGLE